MSDEQDKAKLHAEINQYINQCFIISMTAITVFGAIGGLILGGFISSTAGGNQPQVKPITFLLSIFLVIILSVLFYVSQTTINNLLVLAAYLRQKKFSSWDLDFEQFRAKSQPLRHVDQGESRIFLFLVLGIAALFLPLVLIPFGFQDNTINGVCLALHVLISMAYCIIVFMVLKEKVFRFQKKEVEKLWQEIIT
jgi:MFS family permease